MQPVRPLTGPDMDELCINTIRTLFIDAVQQAKSGHPGTPMALAPLVYELDSKAPGHPKYHWVSGVETTTGPLGQGVATSVGMAVAQKWLGARYNQPGFPVFDYRIYTVCGDGCMMEGVSSEAASLAGLLRQ